MKPDNIGSVMASLQNYYSRMHEQMEESDDLYHKRLDRFVPRTDYDIRIHKTSTSGDIVDGYKNQIRTDEPAVQYLMASNGKKADALRANNEQWGRDMLRRERTYSVIDPSAQNVFDGLLRGAACKKILVDVSKIPGPKPKGKKDAELWKERALTSWPFVSRALDPKMVYPAPGNTRPYPFIIEKQVKTVSDMQNYVIKGDWKDTHHDNNPARPVERLEYWSEPVYDEAGKEVDPGWYIVEVEGQVVESKENPYGFVPIIFEYSGMGRADGDGDPEHLAIGVLTGITGELAKEIETLTAISAMSSSHAFPTILTPTDARNTAKQFAGGGAGRVVHYDPVLGPPVFMQPPPPNNNFFAYLDRIDKNIRKVSGPSLSGQKEPGVNFGVLNAQLMGQQLSYIRPIRGMVNRMGSQTLNMMARLMRRFDFDMFINGAPEEDKDSVISPEDFTHGDFECTFEAVDPSENDRTLLVGEALRRAGDLSQRTFWKVYAKHIIEDPDEEEAQLNSEKLVNLWLESGAWLETVIEEDAAEGQAQQVQGETEGMMAQAESAMSQTNNQARNLEGVAGTPNALNAAKESGQEGQANAFGGII